MHIDKQDLTRRYKLKLLKVIYCYKVIENELVSVLNMLSKIWSAKGIFHINKTQTTVCYEF